MRKLMLLFTALLFLTNIYATTNITVSLCSEKYLKKITKSALSDCSKLIVNHKDWKVKSFEIGFADGTDYLSYTSSDNSIKKHTIDKIKEVSPKKIYIENIVVVNENDEEMKLKTQTVIVTD